MSTPLRQRFELQGQVALVTGGGRGIGLAIAQALAEMGAQLIITGRREEWLTPAATQLREQGYDCLAIKADVTQESSAQQVVEQALAQYGRMDILVNNAGQTWGQATEDMPLDKWRQVLDVNLTGMFLMSRAVGRHMLEQGRGVILNIGSVAGFGVMDPETAKTIAYNTSKAGVIAFTRSLAREWGRRGIRVNAIAPGWFPTRMASGIIQAHREQLEARAALGRIGDLEDLKGAAVFLTSEASAYITGQILVVDGGLSV